MIDALLGASVDAYDAWRHVGVLEAAAGASPNMTPGVTRAMLDRCRRDMRKRQDRVKVLREAVLDMLQPSERGLL